MKSIKLLTFIVLVLFSGSIAAGDFTIGNKTFLLNGEPFIVKAAEVHYPPHPASLLGASHPDVQGVRNEYHLHLHLLEHP